MNTLNKCAVNTFTDKVTALQRRLLALRWSAFVALTAATTVTHAIGLGTIHLQSGLGQPLRASVPVLETAADDLGSACIKAKLESSDGAFIAILQTTITRGAQPTIALSTRQNINEPAVAVFVDVSCTTLIHRSYQLLLDPPSLLPSVSEAQKLEAVRRPSRKNQSEAMLPSLSNVNPGADAPAIAAHGRRAHPTQAAAEVRATSAKAAPAARSNRKKSVRSVLRLSGNDASIKDPGATFNLKMSMQLPESGNESDPKKRDEMRAAQARFAAVLTGDDPSQTTDNQIKALQAEIQKLQSETTRIARQSQADKMALNEVREKSFSLNWIVGLGGLLLVSLAAIAWLIWRVSGLNGMRNAPWWENGVPANITQMSDPTSVPAPPTSDDPMHLEAAGQEDGGGITSAFKLARSTDTPSTAKMKNAPTLQPALFVDSGNLDVTSYSGRLDEFKVEELSGGMEEAEFWMSLHVPKRAIEIMEQYNNGDQPTSPMPWLCLLDLYREVGDEQKYTSLLQHFENLFNVKVPAWNDSAAVANLHRLEDYPHLTKRICDLWNTQGIIPFLESLLYDDRDGARMGFDMPVYREIMLLVNIAYELEQESKRFIKPPVTTPNWTIS